MENDNRECYCGLKVCRKLVETILKLPRDHVMRRGAEMVETRHQGLKQAAIMALRSSKLATMGNDSRAFLRRWHYNFETWVDSADTRETGVNSNVSSGILIMITKNPDPDHQAKYRVDNFEEQRTPFFPAVGRPKKSLESRIVYFNAPTQTAEQFEIQIRTNSIGTINRNAKRLREGELPVRELLKQERAAFENMQKQNERLQRELEEKQKDFDALRRGIESDFTHNFHRIEYWKQKPLTKPVSTTVSSMSSSPQTRTLPDGSQVVDADSNLESEVDMDLHADPDTNIEQSPSDEVAKVTLQDSGNEIGESKPDLTFRELFGFEDPDLLFAVLDAISAFFGEKSSLDCPIDIVTSALSLASELSPDRTISKPRRRGRDMTTRDQLITLMYIRRKIPQRSLSVLVGLSEKSIQRILRAWIPRLALAGKIYSSMPHSAAVARKLVPQDLIECGFGNVFSIVDCRDYHCDTIRVGSSRAQFSSKIADSAIRQGFCIHPYGAYTLITEPCFARVSEISLMYHNRECFDAWPPDMEIMADKGFGALSSIMKHHQHVHIPAFAAKGIPQFSPAQVKDSREMARVRYLVEVSISRIASWARCDHVVPRQDFPNFENFVYIAAGLSVFLKPLASPGSFPGSATIIEAYVRARIACKEPISAP